MRKHRYGLVLVCFTVTVLVLIGTASAKTWYVDDGGGAGIDFTRIQDAVNAAGDGDTIYVYAGTYDECLIVYKSLILQGENRETTIVDAGGGNNGIEITADDCVISGFTIRNCWDTGIELSSSSNGSTITNNVIHSIIGGSDCDGIEVKISSYNVISNNEIFDCDDEAIEIDGSSYNTVTNNTIHSNTDDGIVVRGSLYNCIVNNAIYSNGDDGISLSRSWSIEPIVWGSSQNTITSNDIYLNGGDGIKLKNSSNNIITNNIVYANEDSGIYIKNSSDNRIYHNNLIDNDEQASDDGSDNSWDIGPTVGGNYWSDHECAGNPSNGSQPYYIDSDSIDHYPFEDPIGGLPLLPSLQPKSGIHVHKKEYLSTNDTHIDHRQIYNFTTKWIANVWDVENLDNVTYTITTSKNFTYRSNWELYQNGTENSFILPPIIEGQNYTWVLPLEDRIGSNINFDLESSQTEVIQDNPWVDMDVSTTNENGYTRVNVTLTSVIPLDWIGLRVSGDQIVDVSGCPSEFELKILTSSYVRFENGDINQYQVYNFSVLVDNPNKVSLWLDATFGWVEEPPSNIITLPVAGLGSVTLKADVPVIWEHKQTQPKRGQNIYVELEDKRL